ncbi:MAG: hypothetical protein M1812_007256 [Candelaria pacifica]|nr:MAG: hypothetical protein M1812_007256 [Candelaria pacifica]
MPSMHLSQIRKWLLHSPPAEWGIQQLRELLIGALRQGPIPQHVAFVMDGNRRFARNHQIETVEGHNLGFEALARVGHAQDGFCAHDGGSRIHMLTKCTSLQILEVCYKSGVKVVTIYAFSIENFKRSKYEVDALMDMAKVKLSQLAQHGDLLDHYGASIRILGQRELVKPDVLEAIDRAVSLTSNNKSAILNVCFPYTSRDEITTAIRSTVAAYSQPVPTLERPFSASHITQTIRSRHLSDSNTCSPSPPSEPTSSPSDIEDSASSSTTLHPDSPPSHSLSTDNDHSIQNIIYPDPESITPQTLDDHMFTAGTPPLDLLVRTSGVERLSDFMLWQCHQDTQIVFLECLWPEFDLWSFLPVLVEWQWRRKKIEEKERPLGMAQVGTSVKVR